MRGHDSPRPRSRLGLPGAGKVGRSPLGFAAAAAPGAPRTMRPRPSPPSAALRASRLTWWTLNPEARAAGTHREAGSTIPAGGSTAASQLSARYSRVPTSGGDQCPPIRFSRAGVPFAITGHPAGR